MGVPKFFRYISERYPCLSELVKETQIPEFDNLYLDMNGIIHNCSHPDDGNVQFRITEDQIFLDIFHYIDTLFRMIQPRKLFFMAVDGVAPRAKMNQQRGRRFRAAKDAEQQIELAKKKGEKLPDTDRFDSNCITPGTAFMVRLQNALKLFVQGKISTNPLWRKCKIILSGHETPGEGEHKIMEYIRFQKAQTEFDPNTRHCLYGLDADLVMLGLCSHELHFSLLREEVKFGSKAKKNTSVDNTRFYLLHLGLLREYLELEFISIKDKLTFPFDIENIVDDWIFMCYLVGNDFIPNLPNFHINTNALPILYNTYMEVLPKLDGYINEGGILNLKRLEVFLAALGEVDKNLFNGENANLDCLKGQNMNNDETFGLDMEPCTPNPDRNSDLMDLVQGTNDMLSDDSEDTEETEFYMHKRNYYIKKMGYPEMTPEVLAEQAECYIRALQWTLYYYYRGVRSWSWYYPHHYAPYISDVQNFSHLKFDYDIGKPFLPFQQLLAVLPAASKAHLPTAYHELMTRENSKVIEYYPTDFETDLNGKKQDWEAVVLIPFIDENRLLSAMAEYEHKLTQSELLRNVHGPMYQYEFEEAEQQIGVPSSDQMHFKETLIYRQDLEVPDDRLVLGPTLGVLRDVYFPGFPTMKHLEYTGEIKCLRIKVFDMASRNDSVVVKVINREIPEGSEYDLAAIGAELLGKKVFVGWPHLSEAKIVSVLDRECEITKNGSQKIDERVFNMQYKSLQTHYTTRMGIDVGETQVLVCVLPLLNRSYTFGNQGKMTLQKVWSDNRVYYPLQTIVRDLKVHNSDFTQFTNVEDVFKIDSPVFMISTVYYGSLGMVVDPTSVKQCGRIRITLSVKPEPDFSEAKQIQARSFNRYESVFNACLSLGISTNVFSVITGSFLVVLGEKRFPLPDGTPKVNIGLQLKFPKKNEEVVGYTKKQGNQFLYSKQAIELVELYCQTWPRIFEFLSGSSMHDLAFETELFEESGRLDQICKWLKQQPHANAERRTCGTAALEPDTLRAIVVAVNEVKKLPLKNLRLQVKPHLVYKPGLNHNNIIPDADADFDLFDRVVIAKESHSVPLGFKGTIIAVQSMSDPNPIRHDNIRKSDMFFDVLFDRSFEDGSSIPGIAEKRVFKVSKIHLINISYGLDKFKSTNNESVEKPDEKPTESETKTFASVTSFAPPQLAAQNQESKNSTSNDIWQMLKSQKQPQNDVQPIVAASTISENVNPNINKPLSVITDQEGLSAMMEQLLRAKPAVYTAQQLPMPPMNHEQFRKINVEDMFKVDTINLPQPPPNWRNKMAPSSGGLPEWTAGVPAPTPAVNSIPTAHARPIKGAGKSKGNDNISHSSGSGVAAPKSNDGIYHPQPMNMYPQMISRQPPGPPPPQQTKTFYQSYPPQGPNGPQNLSHNSKYLPGQGAFIPLQATRKNNKTKQSIPQSSAQQVVNNTEPIVPTGNPLGTDQTGKKNFVHPQPRPSRIAARFDMGK